MNHELTLGEFYAGIAGFGRGFEQAGWHTTWQIELDEVNRAVLADRFPDSRQHRDARDWRRHDLSPVHCIAFGSPCQDISIMGNAKRDRSGRGLAGGRSGLFFVAMQAVRALQPAWAVWENVPAIINSNGGRDLQAVIGSFTECGYMGSGRVLDAQYFGIPQKRRRFLLVAGLGRPAPAEFLADAGPMASLPCTLREGEVGRRGDAWAAYTLTSPDKYGRRNSRTNLRSEIFVAEEGGWDSMAERGREVELHGFSAGLDVPNTEQAYAAGNAVPPPMAFWLAKMLEGGQR